MIICRIHVYNVMNIVIVLVRKVFCFYFNYEIFDEKFLCISYWRLLLFMNVSVNIPSLIVTKP